jgi:hypothetical protein
MILRLAIDEPGIDEQVKMLAPASQQYGLF